MADLKPAFEGESQDSSPSDLKKGREVIRRKAHSGFLLKAYVKYIARPFAELRPYIRYAVIPSVMAFSMYWGDPPATLWDLLNPFK